MSWLDDLDSIEIDMSRIRNIDKMNWVNLGDRSLFESIPMIEIIDILKDLPFNNFVIIGTTAYNYYAKPKHTNNLDLLFIGDLPNHTKKICDIIINYWNSTILNIDQSLVEEVFLNANTSDNFKVASIDCIIKLKSLRLKKYDEADIEDLKNIKELFSK